MAALSALHTAKRLRAFSSASLGPKRAAACQALNADRRGLLLAGVAAVALQADAASALGCGALPRGSARADGAGAQHLRRRFTKELKKKKVPLEDYTVLGARARLLGGSCVTACAQHAGERRNGVVVGM